MRRLIVRILSHPRRAVIAGILIGATTALATFVASAEDSPFKAESDGAMAKMMTAMQIESSGDADVDFVAMMVPHHDGAIDMAKAELRYGRNEQLRRLAQEIIVTQQDEIAAMRLALGQPIPEVPAMADHSTAQLEP